MTATARTRNCHGTLEAGLPASSVISGAERATR
jgi:hypothetical protein